MASGGLKDPAAGDGVVARVGLISDTHGVLDPRAERYFRAAGLSAIVHSGDVGTVHILYDLESIAPVTACRGNCDHEALPGWELPHIARVRVSGARILAVHDFTTLGEIPEDVAVVVCGHSHRPRNEWHGSALVVNPGSASQRRSMPSRSVGVLDIAEDGSCEARIVMLDDLDL